ncbi:MAG TPA: metallophosphoesterase, partial [Rhizomicrobium sp.]|nr:metallophosphoesterase [Rhizomicrobium sp.]
MAGPIYFAIGDIHGESRKLRDMHGAILDRIAWEKRAAKIIHLGDYVDRGPDSRSVIDQVMALEKKFD